VGRRRDYHNYPVDSRAGALPSSRHKEVKRALGWDELIDLGLEASG